MLNHIYKVTHVALDSSLTLYLKGWFKTGNLLQGHKDKESNIFDRAGSAFSIQSEVVGEAEYQNALLFYCSHMNSLLGLGACLVNDAGPAGLSIFTGIKAMFGKVGGGGRQVGGRGAIGYSKLIYTLNMLTQSYQTLIDSINVTIVRTFGLKETDYNAQIIGDKIKMQYLVNSVIEQQSGGRRRRTTRARTRRSKRKTRKQ